MLEQKFDQPRNNERLLQCDREDRSSFGAKGNISVANRYHYIQCLTVDLLLCSQQDRIQISSIPNFKLVCI